MLSNFYSNRRGQAPWRDTMQVCLNGHVINSGIRKNPEYNKDHCNRCGEKTITNCPTCDFPIPGDMQDTGVAVIGFPKSPPSFCEKCGGSFPWTKKRKLEQDKKEEGFALETLQQLFSKFHTVVKQLRQRHNKRPTIDVTDEYDVQDIMKALLFVHFDDVRPEEWTPSYAGKSSRMDFLLKNEKIVIETKMTRKNLGEKEVGDELIIDITRYEKHPDCKTLVCFIYDPEGRIVNPTGLIGDLQNQSKDSLQVIVFINPL